MLQASRQLTQILLSKCALSALTDPHVPHRPRRIPRHLPDHISAPRPSIVLKFARVAAPCAPLDIQNSNGKARSNPWFSRRVQNGPTPPPPPSARSQISNGHISATLALFPTRVTTAPMAQRCRTNGVVLFWGIFSAILALNCVLPNNRQRLGPMSTGS